MKRKPLKAILCGLLAAALAMVPVLADTSLMSSLSSGGESSITNTYDPKRKGNVTIDYCDDDATGSGIAGAKFCYYKVGDYENLVGEGNVGSNYVSTIPGMTVNGSTKVEEIADRVFAHYADKEVPCGVTDENGKLIKELETGVYMVAETVPVLGHLPSDPFLISVPSIYSNEGYVEGWNYDIVAYPKPSVVSVGTTLTEEGIHESGAKDKATFTDTVHLKGLHPGETYYLYGRLVDKDSKSVVGKTAKAKITAKAVDEFETMTFTVNTSEMEGKKIVAFEDLYINQVTKDTKISSFPQDKTPSNVGDADHLHQLRAATHSDINDEDQTVHIVKIGTTLTGDNGGKTVAAESTTLNDVVKCTGLIPGNYYILEGELYSKKSGQTTGMKKELSFKAESESQDVTVPFDGLDLTKYAEDSLVAYERLYSDAVKNVPESASSSTDSETTVNEKAEMTASKVLIASHEDIKDEAQTVSVDKKKSDKDKDGDKDKTSSSASSSDNKTGDSSSSKDGDNSKDIANVKTGDNMHVGLFASLLVLAVGVILFTFRNRYKNV